MTLTVKTWLWIWKWNNIQINANKDQTIYRNNDLKLRKDKVITSRTFLHGNNAIPRHIQNPFKPTAPSSIFDKVLNTFLLYHHRKNATLVGSTFTQDCGLHYIEIQLDNQMKLYNWSNFLMTRMTFGTILKISCTPYESQKKLKNNNLIDRTK